MHVIPTGATDNWVITEKGWFGRYAAKEMDMVCFLLVPPNCSSAEIGLKGQEGTVHGLMKEVQKVLLRDYWSFRNCNGHWL